MLQILLSQLPLHPRLRHRPRHRRLRHLLDIAQTRHRALPIRHIVALDLNHGHARIIRRSVMHAVSQVPEPRAHDRRVQFLDLGVAVRDGRRRARDRDPVLRAGVLERDLHLLARFQVREFLRVLVGEEVEVRTLALGDGHGAGDGADLGAVGGQQADFEPVDRLVEVFDLVVFGGFRVPLFGDGGVSFRRDFGGV